MLSSLSVKLKNSSFDIPIIPQTLNITGTKSINLNIIRKFIKYSLKNFHMKAMFTLTIAFALDLAV